MNRILLGYIFGILYAFVVLGLALVLYKLHLSKKYTRKVVHILVGFEWVILYEFMGAGVHFLAVCLFFLAVLTVAHYRNLMPMISSDGENAPGTVYYAVAMTGVAIVGCFVPSVMLPFGIGIIATSVGDGLAGVVGQLVKRYNPKIYGNKTLFGSVANFVATTLGAFILATVYGQPMEIWHYILIGMLSAELELITGFGLDNITITWGITAFTFGLMYYGGIVDYLAPIMVTPVIIAFALSKRALTRWGVAAAIMMDAVISIALGNFGFTILVSFFIGSIIIDKIKKKAPQQGAIEAKGSHRDVVQVIANGLVGTVSAALFAFTGHRAWILGFVCAFAEAFSDTAASGIGAFSGSTYDVFKLKKGVKGLSGGVSLIGTLAAAAGAFAISALALPFGACGFGIVDFLIVGLAAFAGSAIDSLLGSYLQVKYKCPVCGALTEKTTHCEGATVRVGGVSFVDNDVVNLLSGLFSVAIAVSVCLLI